MAQQPGPFGQLTPDDIGVAAGTYDFSDDALHLNDELNAIASSWDATILDLGNFAADPWDVELGLDLGGMLESIAAYSDGTPSSSFNDVLDGWFDAQTSLSDAALFAPAQSWTDPPAAFVPPGDTVTLPVPTINPDTFAPAPNQTVGATTEGRFPAIFLGNITRYGSENFTVGDEFEAIALGPEGADVVLDSSLNGVDLPEVDYGPIDSTGQMFIKGTITSDAVGQWAERWYIAGTIYGSFNFLVAPAET